jgi:hypothetical protein
MNWSAPIHGEGEDKTLESSAIIARLYNSDAD